MGFRLRSNYSLVQNTSILSKKIINRVFMQLNAVYYFLKVHLRASTNVSHSSIEWLGYPNYDSAGLTGSGNGAFILHYPLPY